MSSRLERRSFYQQLGEAARSNQTYVAPSNIRWGTTLTQGEVFHVGQALNISPGPPRPDEGHFTQTRLDLRDAGLTGNADLPPMVPLATYMSAPVYSSDLQHPGHHHIEPYGLPSGPGTWVSPQQ